MKVKVTISSEVDVNESEMARLKRMSPEELLEYLGATKATLEVKVKRMG